MARALHAMCRSYSPPPVMAPRILSGELEVGRLVLASGAFAAMLDALGVLVNNFELLTGFAAGVNRLHGFGQSLDEPLPRRDHATISLEAASHLELKSLTLTTPDESRVLVRDLSLRLEPAQGLLVVGPSGCGKSSLLRAIAGLWQSGSGTILRPTREDVLFLPQRPYMVLGTLRDQLIYPSAARDISDRELRDALARVNLLPLPERCGGLHTELDFGKLLSIGEQQRLAIARALLHRPKYVVLDESTSALDAADERAMYELLRDSHATLISVAHHASLAPYHSYVLELADGGGWTLSVTGSANALRAARKPCARPS